MRRWPSSSAARLSESPSRSSLHLLYMHYLCTCCTSTVSTRDVQVRSQHLLCMYCTPVYAPFRFPILLERTLHTQPCTLHTLHLSESSLLFTFTLTFPSHHYIVHTLLFRVITILFTLYLFPVLLQPPLPRIDLHVRQGQQAYHEYTWFSCTHGLHWCWWWPS